MPLIDDPDSSPIGAVAVFSDVTDELAGKVALRQSEERFRTAVETMLDGFMIWRAVRDADDRVVDFVCEFANAAVAGNGYRPEELIGRRMLDLSPRIDDRYFQRYVEVAESGEPLRMQVPWYDGTKVRGAFDASAVRMGDGVAMTFRDVTQQLEHEHALRESEEQTRRFLEAIPIGVAVVDTSGVVFANEAFRRLLGDLDTEVRGPALVEHFDLRRAGTGEHYPFDELPLARAFFAGEATSADDIVIMRDGVEIPVEGYAAPVRDSSGEVRFALTTLRDITTPPSRRGAIDRRAGGAREHERGARRFRRDRRPRSRGAAPRDRGLRRAARGELRGRAGRSRFGVDRLHPRGVRPDARLHRGPAGVLPRHHRR